MRILDTEGVQKFGKLGIATSRKPPRSEQPECQRQAQVIGHFVLHTDKTVSTLSRKTTPHISVSLNMQNQFFRERDCLRESVRAGDGGHRADRAARPRGEDQRQGRGSTLYAHLDIKDDLFSKTHLGHERGGIFMLAVRYAAVAARGCSSAMTAAAAAAVARSAAGSGSAAAAVAASAGAGAGAARAKSASRGCSRLIAPPNGFLSHRPASLILALLYSFLFFLFRSLARSLTLARFFTHRIFARRKGVLRARWTRVSRRIEPTDRPSDNGCGSAGG